MATHSPESEFNFGLTIDDPELSPFTLDEIVLLAQHTMQLTNSSGKKYFAPCPVRTGKVVELQKPLLRDGRSFIARVRCENDACGYKITLKR